MRRSRAVLGAAGAALVVAVAATILPTGAGAGAAPDAVRAIRYVALGDSYTAAPGVPPVAASAPAHCAQSGSNYPHQFAAAIGTSVRDVSCSGAKTVDLTQAQYTDVPAQIRALDADTTLVTVGIGGNDDDLFARAVASCATTSANIAIGAGSPCADRFGDQFRREIKANAPAVRAALHRIQQVSPRARVVVIGYPNLLPRNPVGRLACLAAGVPFTPGDIAYLDRVERDLNAMLRSAAKATGADYLDTYTPSVGRDMCAPPLVRWIEPPIVISPAAPIHPNAAGQENVAKLLLELVTKLALR
ncbi:MAG: SGNH/GDSL hydrolase family protein [Sporichthyaceae bacterium]